MFTSTLLQQTIQNPVLVWFFLGPFLLILVDLLTGIGAAYCTHSLTWSRLPDFLAKDLAKYIIASLAIFLFGFLELLPLNIVVACVGFLPLSAAVVQSIVNNLREIQTGKPVSTPLVGEVLQVLPEIEKKAETIPATNAQPLQPFIMPGMKPHTTTGLIRAIPGKNTLGIRSSASSPNQA